jgi:hypothetical protein
MLTRIRGRLSRPFGARAGPYRVAPRRTQAATRDLNRGGTRGSANAGLDTSPRGTPANPDPAARADGSRTVIAACGRFLVVADRGATTSLLLLLAAVAEQKPGCSSAPRRVAAGSYMEHCGTLRNDLLVLCRPPLFGLEAGR